MTYMATPMCWNPSPVGQWVVRATRQFILLTWRRRHYQLKTLMAIELWACHTRAVFKIVAASLDAMGAFKIVACFLHHGTSEVRHSLPEKLTIIEIYEFLIWYVTTIPVVRLIQLDILDVSYRPAVTSLNSASRYNLGHSPAVTRIIRL